MDKFWDEATFLLEVPFLKLTGQDKDGIDLSFTQSKVAVSSTKRESNLRKAMERARPKYQQSVLETDMHAALKGIFDQYSFDVAEAKKKGKRIKDLTLIVLTDGIWTAMRDPDQVRRESSDSAKDLKGNG